MLFLFETFKTTSNFMLQNAEHFCNAIQWTFKFLYILHWTCVYYNKYSLDHKYLSTKQFFFEIVVNTLWKSVRILNFNKIRNKWCLTQQSIGKIKRLLTTSSVYTSIWSIFTSHWHRIDLILTSQKAIIV